MRVVLNMILLGIDWNDFLVKMKGRVVQLSVLTRVDLTFVSSGMAPWYRLKATRDSWELRYLVSSLERQRCELLLVRLHLSVSASTLYTKES